MQKDWQDLAQGCPQALPALFHGPAATPLSTIGCVKTFVQRYTTPHEFFFHISGKRKGEKHDKSSGTTSAVPWGWIGCETLMLGQVCGWT